MVVKVKYREDQSIMTKVAFIVCYNHTIYMKECMDYISWLNIPEGVETEVIGVADADSMTSGYNAAMNSSDAKYKVYLHQDVFILNKNFIRDMITVFENHSEYGMLGVIGGNRMIADAIYWDKWNVGEVYAWDTLKSVHLSLGGVQDLVESVDAIDGMIMMTQYDVPWKQDIFDGFDFYDISQSKEFLLAGYKVGVVKQEQPWCFHDCGDSSLSEYDRYRKRFCETYKELGYLYTIDEQIENRKIRNRVIDNVIPQITDALEVGDLVYLNSALDVAIDYYPFHTKLFYIHVLTEIITKEKNLGVEHGFYVTGMKLNDLIEKYMLYRFLLKRLELGNSIKTLQAVVKSISISDERLAAEKIIAGHTVFDQVKVMNKLKSCLSKNSKRTYCNETK